MIDENSDFDDLLKNFGESIENDPFHLEKENEPVYEISYRFPYLDNDFITTELKKIAKLNNCSVKKLYDYIEEKNLIYGYYSGYSNTSGLPVGNVLCAPKNSKYQINDFIYFNSFFGNSGNHCISNANRVSFCTGDDNFIDSKSNHVPNPFIIKKEKSQTIVEYIDQTNTEIISKVESDKNIKEFVKIVGLVGKLYEKNPDWLVNGLLKLKSEIMLNEKLVKTITDKKLRKRIYSAINYYDKMARDGLIKKIGYLKVKKTAAEKNNVSIDFLSKILGARNGFKRW
jgi:hypothetical protein